jgi:hypothetical protein
LQQHDCIDVDLAEFGRAGELMMANTCAVLAAGGGQ